MYRFWEANGTAYLVMPFYEGITVKDKLKEMVSPPDEAWLLAMLAPLTEALAVIHAENCFHRDIAPDNVILLAGTGKPLLLDFGAARRVIGDMTQALTVILKPGYAPVEQYRRSTGHEARPLDRCLCAGRHGLLRAAGQDAAALGQPFDGRQLCAFGGVVCGPLQPGLLGQHRQSTAGQA
ncbi:protein kinase domain-containing protein [Roseateles sp. GG27B]